MTGHLAPFDYQQIARRALESSDRALSSEPRNQPECDTGENEHYLVKVVAANDLQQNSKIAPPFNDHALVQANSFQAGAKPHSEGSLNVAKIRNDFPILKELVHGKPLIWLDNAATTHKPRAVIERLVRFYEQENSNIHRAAHALAERATDAYEKSRATVARFLGAEGPEQIVFARGTTELINFVAQSWGFANIKQGDEILISWLEHHANIVPWQLLAERTGARLVVAPVNERGELQLDEFERLVTSRTKLVSVTHVSNALGTITPVAEITRIAHRYGARVLIDGAQAVSHMPVDVQAIGCDWYVFSGHKVFGPTGIGALYGRSDVLNASPAWQGGGNMIEDVTFERSIYQAAPARFEAGTGNIADAIGLGAALEYLEGIGMSRIARYETELLHHATDALLAVPGLRLIGTATEKASVLSFVINGLSPEQVGKALSEAGIAVRSGHHCAQPILRRYGLEATVRPSLAFYNTYEEIRQLQQVLLSLVSNTSAAPRHRFTPEPKLNSGYAVLK